MDRDDATDPAPPLIDPAASAYTPAPLPVARLDRAQRLACLRLIRSDGIGPVSFRALINHFGGAAEALAAVPEFLRKAAGRRTVRICPADRAEAELDAALALGMLPLFTIEPGYPASLARIDVPPPLIYARGRLELLGQTAVAIVGSRDASAGGHTLARRFAGELSAAGLVIVSGLARGIDGAAHRAALDGGTVAVVAGGVDVVYPPEHASLHAQIAERGCLISEMPPGFQPRGQDFPRRNRLIAGLALAVVVVEAAKRSGTLITARYASEMGREVCVVPGHPLDPRAEGTNQLLKGGATLVTSSDEILAAIADQRHHDTAALVRGLSAGDTPLDWPVAESADRPTPASPLEPVDAAAAVERIFAVLGPAPASIDDVARAAHMPIHAARAALFDLTLAGRVELHGAQLVSRRV